jgi:hypothetical protein
VIYYDRYDQGAPVVDISADHIQKKAKKKILVLYGWLFRNASGFDQQQDYVKSSFAIDEKFVQVARHQVLEYRKNREVLVGVHIRRGDYKRFENGRWFFEDAVYLDKMQSIKAQLDQRGLSTGFVLCSNEDINLYFFRQNLQVDHKKDAFIIDFLTLSMADFIIGPPSTFSAMASLFGNVPLQFINEAGADVSLTGFKAKAGLYV